MRRLEDLEENLLVKDNYSHQKSQIRTDPKGKRKTTTGIKAKEREYSDKEGLLNCIKFFINFGIDLICLWYKIQKVIHSVPLPPSFLPYKLTQFSW